MLSDVGVDLLIDGISDRAGTRWHHSSLEQFIKPTHIPKDWFQPSIDSKESITSNINILLVPIALAGGIVLHYSIDSRGSPADPVMSPCIANIPPPVSCLEATDA